MPTASQRFTALFAAHVEERSRLDAVIERAQRERGRLTPPLWLNDLVQPLVADIAALTEMADRDIVVNGPLNLNGDVAIHAYRKGVPGPFRLDDGNCLSLTLTPGNLRRGEFNVRPRSQYTGGDRLDHPVPHDANAHWFLQWFS